LRQRPTCANARPGRPRSARRGRNPQTGSPHARAPAAAVPVAFSQLVEPRAVWRL